MSATDKAKNTMQGAKGKVKQAAGRATGNNRLAVKGRNDQTKSHAKQAGEKLRDTFKS